VTSDYNKPASWQAKKLTSVYWVYCVHCVYWVYCVKKKSKKRHNNCSTFYVLSYLEKAIKLASLQAGKLAS